VVYGYQSNFQRKGSKAELTKDISAMEAELNYFQRENAKMRRDIGQLRSLRKE